MQLLGNYREGKNKAIPVQTARALRVPGVWGTKVVKLLRRHCGRKDYVNEDFQWHPRESNPWPSLW